ncbi:hypothetical protein OIU74_019657 [Salix koriyanagi]|uniref:Uncharacterized protein n=1 Tax=Salix koriyanagi TaxID=2511006 RepID=A0A9Q0P475_9ROSI|nr:hypothetical protein OIU74_019657 [Salix koriyanagi]
MERVSQKAKAVVSFFMGIMDTTCEKLAASICLFRVDARLVQGIPSSITGSALAHILQCRTGFLITLSGLIVVMDSYCSVVVGVTSTSSSELSSKSHAARIV